MYYTKYRPQKFSEIFEPDDAAIGLMNQVKNGKTVHAYLFLGPRGTGKTTTARLLAKALNCTNIQKNGDPCDKCDNCLAVKNGSFFDLIEIDAASNRGIDDIRDLRDKVRLAPSVGENKIYIIDEVHMLTTEAFNALLKTLEEPPKHVTFILCTTEPHKVPDTIKSRCQVFKFKRASVKQIVDRLEFLSEKEKVKLTKKELEMIARASFGGFRDAETLLQQVAEGGIDPKSLVLSSNKEDFLEFTDSLVDYDAAGAFRKIDNVYEDGIDLTVWAGELVKYLRDLLFVKMGADSILLDLTDDLRREMEKQVKRIEIPRLVSFIEQFSEAQVQIKSSTIPQLPLELAVAHVCSDSNGYSEGGFSKGPNLGDGVGGDWVKSGSSFGERKSESVLQSKKGNSEGVEKDNDKRKASNKQNSGVKLEHVEEKWAKVLEEAVKYNHSVHALLKSSSPANVDGRFIVLEVYYSFHKDRLESPRNRKIVEEVLLDVFDSDLTIKCNVNNDKSRRKKPSSRETGELTDKNIVAPEIGENKVFEGSIIDVFDGGLPIE